ncbi:type 1 glutamine amidotransferase domain-containing protein [Companilactobacillus halodurans]|uniref:Type 1 glutamine amidotransferase n=1 Tax=Companilactobacillus halodurans TaxID=2584183 RepID=A0A5P0ZVM0_9LACO|nr:type 1 glutamine amidotransferase domain-containing protein [Companilactobacillus halodurans]MQS75063.1 type 1 glutamine amidotransferase [Companilactobacillus halodurans]MQS96868.1 type 1 glutamine amidotransferase [Companilactobacillus halodurans]
MSKIIAVMANDVEDIEYTSPAKALTDAGNEVTLVGANANEKLTGKHGTEFTTDKGIDDIKADDYDALLIPGGFSPDNLRSDDRFVELAKKFMLTDKAVFSICHGPQLLMQTGLVKGRTLTSYETVQTDLYYAGGIVKDEPVVIDRHLITSRTPDDLDAFNKAIVNELA